MIYYCTPAEVPIRSAPAAINSFAKAKSRYRPKLLSVIFSGRFSRINFISATEAPRLEKPVEVFTKSASASAQIWQAVINFFFG